jgi:O-antigen/teichoic acid export membrane protein
MTIKSMVQSDKANRSLPDNAIEKLSPRRKRAEEKSIIESNDEMKIFTTQLQRRNWREFNLNGLKLPLTVSLLNQCISSGGNFLLSIYLARTLSLGDFGLYGIGYGLCMLYVGVGNSLILTQMVIHMPSKKNEDKEAYAAKMLSGVLMLGFLLVTFSSLVLALLNLFWHDASLFIETTYAVTTAAIAFLGSEFFISYAYIKRREGLALIVNSVTMIALFSMLILESQSGITPTANHVLYSYALASAIGSLTAYSMSSLRIRDGIEDLRPDLIESWQLGRWALGGVCITWIQSQTYAYIALLFLGPVGVGQANAAKIFISPFSFLLPAINKIALPRLADLRETDPQKVLPISGMMTIGITSLSVIYSAILFSSLSFVTTLVLGRQDTNIQALICLWCLVLMFQMIRAGGSVLLQVQRKFKILTLLNIPSAVMTLLLALVLIKAYGASGAIWSMAAGEITLSFLIWRKIFYDHSRQN